MMTESSGVSNSSGPHHSATCSGSVHACHTCSRGASKVRTIETWWCWDCVAESGIALSSLEVVEVRSEPVHPALPQRAIRRHPLRCLLERLDPQRARPVLRRAVAGDQAGALEHLQVPGDRG